MIHAVLVIAIYTRDKLISKTNKCIMGKLQGGKKTCYFAALLTIIMQTIQQVSWDLVQSHACSLTHRLCCSQYNYLNVINCILL